MEDDHDGKQHLIVPGLQKVKKRGKHRVIVAMMKSLGDQQESRPSHSCPLEITLHCGTTALSHSGANPLTKTHFLL